MSELTDLLARYGLADASRTVVGGTVKPTDPTDPDYAEQMRAYEEDLAAKQAYEQGFNTRTGQFDLYGQGWQGDKLQAPTLKNRRPVPRAVVAAVAPSAVGSYDFGQRSGGGGSRGIDEFGGLGLGAAGIRNTNDPVYNPLTKKYYDVGPYNWEKGIMGFFGSGLSPLGLMSGMSLTPNAVMNEATRTIASDDAARAAMASYTPPAAEQDFSDLFGYASGSAGGGNSGGGSGGYNSDGSDAGGYGTAPNSNTTGNNWACGGLVKKYADGGEVDSVPGQGLDLSRVSPEQLKFLQQQDPQAVQRGVARFAGVEPVATEVEANPMAAMLEKYAAQPSKYATEYEESRKASAEAAKKFEDMLTQQMERTTESGPSKAEMYFNLAAAFGAPTKTGSFYESAANAAQVMGAHTKAQREGEAAKAAERRKLELLMAQNRAEVAKQDSSDLRVLAGEESRERRAAMTEMLKDYLKSGQPQSEAGKAAVDAGLKRGTPSFNEFVNKYINDKMEASNAYKSIMAGVAQTNAGIAEQRLDLAQKEAQRKEAEGKKLTNAELKLKTETEDLLASTDQAYKNLTRALELNNDVFGATFPEKAQRFVLENTTPRDPRIIATREQENLLSKAGVEKLRAAFGGNPTEGERKILLDLEGIGAKSTDERKLIMEAAAAALRNSYRRQKQRLADINAGKYRQTVPQIEKDSEEQP